MSGVRCLQGGVELTPGCRDMDRAVLDRCAGPVVVLAGAARVGSDYAGAVDRARRHYEALGADVVGAPDPRTDEAGTLAALQRVGLLVLPGGSPASLHAVLSGAVGERVLAVHREGAGITGASAGAMVMCERTWLPSTGQEVEGLGLAPGQALVHWAGPGRRGLPDDGVLRWGLPERGGVLIDGGTVLAVGEGTPSWHRAGRWRALPRDVAVPLP